MEFVQRYANDPVEGTSDQDDLFDKFGIDGDDAFEFIESFGSAYDVDMTEYCWYFHNGEEGWGIGGLFFKPPYARVERIPITLKVLRDAIDAKKWPVQYPPHELPNTRWDLHINQMWLIVWVVLFAIWAISKFLD